MIWRCYYAKHGDHVHCRLFVGPAEGALGLAGTLVFRSREFTEFTGLSKTLPMSWRREVNDDGSLDGDDDVIFAELS
jgi:hypothetical protein